MRTELSKSSRRGFNLTEQELRRLIALLHDQFGKPPCAQPPLVRYIVRLRNGALLDTHDIEQVLSIENGGATAIERLRITGTAGGDGTDFTATIQFSDVSRDNTEEPPILYKVIGNDRDWVFVLTSELDERLARIRRWALDHYFASKRAGPSLNTLGFFVTLMAGMLWTFSSIDKSRRVALATMDSLYTAGALSDPIKATLQIERLKIAADSPPFGLMFTLPFAYLLITTLALFLYSRLATSFVFYWGDMIGVVDRRRKITNFILGVIVLGLVLSVAGSLLANRIHL